MLTAISSDLALLDSQRESTFASLYRLTDSQIWRRPAPKEWNMGIFHDQLYFDDVVKKTRQFNL